jgi:hypothetical protein
MLRFRSIYAVAFLVIGLLAPIASAQQQPPRTKTYIINQPSSFGGGGWSCGDLLAILYSGTYDVSYDDTLPTGSQVTAAHLVFPARRSGAFYASGDADPFIDIAINGVPMGGQSASGYVSCPTEADLIPYAFDTQLSQGSGYIVGSSNDLRFNVQGGTCPFWCGISIGKYLNPQIATLEITYIPPPPISFQITDVSPASERRILLSNARPEYPYPHFQGIGSRDAEVYTSLTLRDGYGNPQPGMNVYMRVTDPPDPAAYMNLASLPAGVKAAANDNTGTQATIEGTGITETAPNSHIYQATSGANGLVPFTLKLQPPFVAGDNYQIEASSDPAFPPSLSAKSGTLTAWKRIFVEKRRMLKNGVLIAEDAAAGASAIIVNRNHYLGDQGSSRTLRAGDRIVLVHAPLLDRSDSWTGWYCEEHTIATVTAVGTTFRVNLGTVQGKTITPEFLQHSYHRPEPAEPRIGDGVALLAGQTLSSSDYYDTSDSLVTGLFPDAFTEYIFLDVIDLPGIGVPVPFISSGDELMLQHLADKWSRSVSYDPFQQTWVNPPNHQYLVIASDAADQNLSQRDTGKLNEAVAGRISSYVFRKTIRDVAGSNTVTGDRWAMKTEAHELGHQWLTNRGVWPSLNPRNDHCAYTTTAYNSTTVYCLLGEANTTTTETQRANGIAVFHMQFVNNVWHSEYLGIRRRTDPFRP